MKISNLNLIWEKMEKFSIYLILLAFFILQFLTLFIPKLSDFMSNHGSVTLIALVMLSLFRYADKNLSQKTNDLTLAKKFTLDMIKILIKSKMKYNTVDIFALSSYKYYNAIQESKIKIKNCRLLVRDVDNEETIQFPVDKNEKIALKSEAIQIIKKWWNLKNEGFIENLKIAKYPFDTILHFMIIDDELAHFGLLKPKKEFPGSDVLNSYIVSNKTYAGRELIAEFNEEFNAIFNIFAKE